MRMNWATFDCCYAAAAAGPLGSASWPRRRSCCPRGFRCRLLDPDPESVLDGDPTSTATARYYWQADCSVGCPRWWSGGAVSSVAAAVGTVGGPSSASRGSPERSRADATDCGSAETPDVRTSDGSEPSCCWSSWSHWTVACDVMQRLVSWNGSWCADVGTAAGGHATEVSALPATTERPQGAGTWQGHWTAQT